MQQGVIRVAIVDDNDMVLFGLSISLQAFVDIEVVGEGHDGWDAIKLCQEVAPDVMLIDLVMPDMDGVAAIREIRRSYPHVRCVALTLYDDLELVRGALQAGATSYVVKNLHLDALAEAIRKAYRGGMTFSPEAVQVLRRKEGINDEHTLSPREREMLLLVMDGVDDEGIAARMSLDTSTVTQEIDAVVARLDSSNRAEALMVAHRDNLI